MVLARCCPAWISGVVHSPQPFHLVGEMTPLGGLLRNSLLWGASLSDLFGADYPRWSPRTEVNWVFWGYRTAHKVYLKSFVHQIQTVGDLWSSAWWFERELWEMFGVGVAGHPDLRRLITDYGFVGWPLRKDFPVGGYLEVRYSEVHRRVVSRPLALTQEFRSFDFKSPWHA